MTGVLLRWIALRRLFGERRRTLVTVLGVGLGVAVFVAIRLANTSALASFGDTVDAVAGRANLRISAGSEGVDERLYLEARRVPGVLAAAPVIEVPAPARPGTPLPAVAIEAGSIPSWRTDSARRGWTPEGHGCQNPPRSSPCMSLSERSVLRESEFRFARLA